MVWKDYRKKERRKERKKEGREGIWEKDKREGNKQDSIGKKKIVEKAAKVKRRITEGFCSKDVR